MFQNSLKSFDNLSAIGGKNTSNATDERLKSLLEEVKKLKDDKLKLIHEIERLKGE